MVGLIFDDLFLAHGSPTSPENRGRLDAVWAHLETTGYDLKLLALPFASATVEEVAWLHSPDYLELLRGECEAPQGYFGPDTLVSPQTYAAAMLAAGGCMDAAEAALDAVDVPGGDVALPTSTLCLVRPPGHHALREGPKGFCFLNNAALAAQRAISRGLDRVAIVDFDAHHGNGTQEAFYHRRDVLVISLHEHGLFPGTGSLDEVGVERGAGFTLNLPMLPGAGDEHYRRAFEAVVLPALDAYRPELVIISAGYDAHYQDPLAHLNLTAEAYHFMVGSIAEAADRHANGRVVAVLEGGYDEDALSWGIENTVRALEGEAAGSFNDPAPEVHPSASRRIAEALDVVITTHSSRLGL
jgi:acetoin utilization deacetylase AcuC-like enzyme